MYKPNSSLYLNLIRSAFSKLEKSSRKGIPQGSCFHVSHPNQGPTLQCLPSWRHFGSLVSLGEGERSGSRAGR
jgi:hypothetical protein